ncbi:DUF421 domain-containing protein [Paenibacillus sp. Z3-2]
MENIYELTIRVICALVVVLLFFRITGKKEVGELGVLEVIVSVMVADLAVRIIDQEHTPIWVLILPLFILTLLQLIISYVKLKNQKVRHVIEGKPVYIIKDSELLKKNMIEQSLNLDELMAQLRQKDIWDLRDVYCAILEPEGTLSVLKTPDKGQFSLPLIQNGVIQNENIEAMELSRTWIISEVHNRGEQLESVFYLSYKGGEMYWIFNE